MKGIQYVRYEPRARNAPGVHPWVVDHETKVLRAEACAQAAEALKQHGFEPDVIVAHPGWGETLLLREVWPKAAQLHYVEWYYSAVGQDTGFDAEFEDPDPKMAWRLRLKNTNNLLNLHDMDWGICPTQWQASTVPARFQDQITVIHDGVDTSALHPNPQARMRATNDAGLAIDLGAEDEVITFVNRNLEPFRGYHTMVRALPELQRLRPLAHVVIIGGDGTSYGQKPKAGTWKMQFKGEVSERVDWTRVHYLGNVPYATFVAAMQISRVHVYLTYPFVLSWSMLEAMSMGAVVVASDTAPVREVIQDGHNGFLVNFFDPIALARRIAGCAESAHAMAPIRAAARQTVIDHYDLKTHCLPRQIELVEGMIKAMR